MSDHGKWSETGVPHSGWVCIGFEDLGDESITCEMCGSARVRYVHTMYHATGLTLECGCVCAGNMEGDTLAAKARETRAKNERKGRTTRLGRATTWLEGWFPSRNNSENVWKRVSGGIATVFKKGSLYAGVFGGRFTAKYPDQRDAMLALYRLVQEEGAKRLETFNDSHPGNQQEVTL